jgi:DNA-binding CsgD family transcriptional regulator
LVGSPVTIRSHIASAVKKLNTEDRDDALRMFDA